MPDADLFPGDTDSDAVVVEDLAVSFGDLRAVDGLTFSVGRGTVTALLGPNGAGKTTTVEVCEGYRRQGSGRVRVLGLDPQADAAALRPRVGVMLQSGGVPASSRAVPALRHLAGFYRDPLDVDDLAERLGLDQVRATYRRMSGGERQRLGLACALVGRPELVFLDEPTAGMDPRARIATWEVVEQLRTDGVTVVLTTHLLDEAERLADHVVVVDRGRVVAAGSPADLTGDDEHLSFRAEPGLDTASLAAVLPDGSSVVEESPGVYRIDSPVGAELLGMVAAWCAERGVVPRGLTTARRSLEDVFLGLTGREPRP